jgi:hypothetical protein
VPDTSDCAAAFSIWTRQPPVKTIKRNKLHKCHTRGRGPFLPVLFAPLPSARMTDSVRGAARASKPSCRPHACLIERSPLPPAHPASRSAGRRTRASEKLMTGLLCSCPRTVLQWVSSRQGRRTRFNRHIHVNERERRTSFRCVWASNCVYLATSVPDTLHLGIFLDRLIGGDERERTSRCLGDEQAVEWIAVPQR